MPSQDDRDLVDSLLQNQDIVQPSFIYRPDDPYFGVARNIIYTHAYGLTSSTLEDYVTALELNHFRKQLVLGEFKVAQARAGNTGNIVYEVVYSEVQDSGVNERGESPPQSVPTAFPIPNPDGPGTIDQVYPNSLIEMRDQVIDTVGQYAQVLPLWMTSKQENGRVLGFTRAVIVAYCLPGRGEQLAYNIRTEWGERLNLVDFIADRYILDRQYSKNWDPVTESWVPSPAQATTFDVDNQYSVQITSPGSGYNPGDQIIVSGGSIGGTNTTNDLSITIQSVRSIDVIEISGTLGSLNIGDYVGTVASTTQWNPIETYSINEIVVFDGPIYYQAKQNVPGDMDPNNWIDITNTAYWEIYNFVPSSGVIINKISNSLIISRIGNNIPFSNVIQKLFPDTTGAGNFIIGQTYRIQNVGTTDFTLIGASVNQTNADFVATGVGSGNGTATSYSTTNCVNVTTTSGIIVNVTISGQGDFEAKGQTYNNVSGTRISGVGVGAVFSVSVPNSTIFDDGSLLFTSPVDNYGLTDQYNKYLLYPKYNILEGPPEPPPPPPITLS
jgi:hypothetical protein